MIVTSVIDVVPAEPEVLAWEPVESAKRNGTYDDPIRGQIAVAIVMIIGENSRGILRGSAELWASKA
jgi:hypothetical protein